MRPPRLLILLSCFVALPILLTFGSLIYSHPPGEAATESTQYTQKPGGLRSLFSFHTPSALFPPSAIISLTDENSTFFLARPANFGKILPVDGLSGQLWAGTGFGGDDGFGRGMENAGTGELGCSDVPGWSENHPQRYMEKKGDKPFGAGPQRGSPQAVQDKGQKKERSADAAGNKKNENLLPDEQDGTDDHLHHPLSDSQISKQNKPGEVANHESLTDGVDQGHADIQSLQEGAEIAGKIVILRRGGCGFLEKVKWVQRRGGVALIVGDDKQGGPLITMNAHGDTSNVTIPSLFTSYTTGSILSSLVPLQRMRAEKDPEQDTAKADKIIKKLGPTFTTGDSAARATGTPRPSIRPASGKISTRPDADSTQVSDEKGWLRSALSAFSVGSDDDSDLPADSRRPPSSGRVNWIISDNWNDEPKNEMKSDAKTGKAKRPDEKPSMITKPKSKQNGGDGFVIGVQDWRDPDLHADTAAEAGKKTADAKTAKAKEAGKSAKSSDKKSKKPSSGPTGGSITPGSGEYRSADGTTGGMSLAAQRNAIKAKYLEAKAEEARESQGWLGGIFGGDDDDEADDETFEIPGRYSGFVEEVKFEEQTGETESFEEHEGLWVTLTPTTISSSPFFDTLLVLVVSPLITLTVVYAMLLLRSRIRRRRWRAPKSVVDRLPVRTYHTMSDGSTTTSAQVVPSQGSHPTSPLLSQTSPRSSRSRPRPRSQTTSGIGDLVDTSLNQATNSLSKRAPPPAPVRKKYTGKQVECVVCLEEYIDGQSRVMSLPCGHEFHAECITPWLTTRRRTCPICKGDVVRSLATQTPSPTSPTGSRLTSSSQHPSPTTTHSRSRTQTRTSASDHQPTDAADDEIQHQAASTINDSPSSAIPIPHRANSQGEIDLDLERGLLGRDPNDGSRDGRGTAIDDNDDNDVDLATTLVNDRGPDGPFAGMNDGGGAGAVASSSLGSQGSREGRRGWRGLAELSLSAFSGEAAAWRGRRRDGSRGGVGDRNR
ncbi:hypothetical protein MMC25_002913 [Agyrium rufum]|nr:hypothetical protein [Agyrium rufum]